MCVCTGTLVPWSPILENPTGSVPKPLVPKQDPKGITETCYLCPSVSSDEGVERATLRAEGKTSSSMWNALGTAALDV